MFCRRIKIMGLNHPVVHVIKAYRDALHCVVLALVFTFFSIIFLAEVKAKKRDPKQNQNITSKDF